MAEGIARQLGRDGHYYRLSDYIREGLAEKGIKEPDTDQMQDEGNRLRKEHGLQYLIDRCAKNLSEKERAGEFTADSVILIDGIRNTGEVRTLRTSPNFYLVSIHASKEVRKSRLVAPGKLFGSAAQFDRADMRDLEEDVPWGQKVQVCNDLADIIVNNEDPKPEGTRARTEFFNRFITDHVTVMRALRDGTAVPDRPPSMDETLMTMAFCASLRSSCEKRKVGAVIAHVKTFPKISDRIKRKEDDKRYQVISSGYNEVPLGTPPCRLSDDGGCYRDKLKKRISEQFQHCPRCGKDVPDEYVGDYDKLLTYQCDCGASFEAYLPGSGGEAGRLLDMCRALHAEENAILGLAGVSKNSGGELVLYTTTFPCNLCANKIVEAGIRAVVYAEPYPMREAWDILELAGVRVKKFEGVKSSAYFRIYAA